MPGISPKLARGFFAVLALAIAAWWALLFAWPAARAPFRLAGAPEIALLGFAPADLLAALAAGWIAASPSSRPARTALAWCVAGAMVYASAYTVALAVTCAAGPLGAILMAPAALGSLAAARALHHADAHALPDGRSR